MATQLSLLADAGHVIAGIADGAQDASIFGRQKPIFALIARHPDAGGRK
jgi:hypothetical protein